MSYKTPKCKSCPYGMGQRVEGTHRYECVHPFCRKKRNFFGHMVPIVCPIVDPMSATLDLLVTTPATTLVQCGLFNQDAALERGKAMRELKDKMAHKEIEETQQQIKAPRQRRKPVSSNAQVPQPFQGRTPKIVNFPRTEKGGLEMTYDDMVAAACIIQETIDWERDANSNLMGQLFDAICVFCFAMVVNLLAGFLPALVPVSDVYFQYVKFAAGAVKSIATIVIVARVIRHARFLHCLQSEREKTEVALSVALAKGKYTREKLDIEARKRGEGAC